MSLCPPNTVIRDYAYPQSHPLWLAVPNHRQSLDEYSDESDLAHEHALDYSPDEINRRAIALFDFQPENDNEVALKEGQMIWILYRHGQGWLVAEEPESGENGLVPEEYVEILPDEDVEDEPRPFMPKILRNIDGSGSEWEDTDEEEEEVKSDGLEEDVQDKLASVTI